MKVTITQTTTGISNEFVWRPARGQSHKNTAVGVLYNIPTMQRAEFVVTTASGAVVTKKAFAQAAKEMNNIRNGYNAGAMPEWLSE